MIKAAEAFVAARADLNPEQKSEERMQMRKRLSECMQQNSLQLVIATAAAAIRPEGPDEFIQFLQSPQAADFHIDHSFQPHKPTFRRLYRITGKIGQTISVAFDVEDVQTHRVSYDPDLNAIVLTNPPEALKQSILENGTAD